MTSFSLCADADRVVEVVDARLEAATDDPPAAKDVD